MTWKEDVELAIRRHFPVGEVFSTSDFWLAAEQELADRHPTVKDVRNTVLNILQKLRDDRVLEFMDYKGHYRLRP